MQSLLSNTEELLLVCSRKDLIGPQQDRASALIREGIDWESFSNLAQKNRVTILVYDSLGRITPSPQVPQPVLDRLKSVYFSTMQKTVYQHNYILGLLGLFAEKKIPAIPLKGTILAKRIYGDIAARGSSGDGDLLVEEKNIKPAQALMEKAGYCLGPESPNIKPWQCWFIKKNAMPIDMHWDITKMGRSRERIEEFWKRTRLAEEEGVGYYEFREDELLLYHSAQIVNDCSFLRLRNICDIDRFLFKYKNNLNWSRITEMAKRWKLSSSLYAALTLSKRLFNSNVPEEALRRIRPNPFKIALLNFFVNKRVIMGSGFRRRLMDILLRPIFFEIIEAESAGDYFSIIFPPGELRSKSWAARLAKGASALPNIMPKREKPLTALPSKRNNPDPG